MKFICALIMMACVCDLNYPLGCNKLMMTMLLFNCVQNTRHNSSYCYLCIIFSSNSLFIGSYSIKRFYYYGFFSNFWFWISGYTNFEKLLCCMSYYLVSVNWESLLIAWTLGLLTQHNRCHCSFLPKGCKFDCDKFVTY